MADIKRLAGMLQELDDLLTRCMRCGLCQAQCPVFARTGREADVTRGKLALLSGLSREMLTDPAQVREKIDTCLLCGTCEANCPSGVKVTDIFLRARAILNGYMGLSPAQRLIFRRMLPRPKLMNALLSMSALFQGLFSKEADPVIGSSCARFNAPLIRDRHFKKLAKKPLHRQVPSVDTPAGASGLKVAFFPGCLTDKIYPGVGLAALKIFKHHQVGVYMPAGQACCGIPALSSGEADAFSSLVRQNAELFSAGKWDYLVTPCATCTATMHKLWPEYHRGSLGRVITDNIMDVSQFMIDVLGVKPFQNEADKTPVAYHDPCHLRNTMKITAQPRSLIEAGGRHTVAELPGGPSCCGSGGSFNLKHYKLSTEIGLEKARAIGATNAPVAATGCPACMLQLTDMMSREHVSIPIRHVLELYAENL